MRRFLLCLLAASCGAAPAAAETDLAVTYQGSAFVRTDALDRVVIVLDVTGDGLADDVFIFDPIEKIAGGIETQVTPAEVTTHDDDLSLKTRDGHLALELHATSPPDGVPPTAWSGPWLRAYGRALLHQWYAPAEVAIEILDTDAIRTFAECGENDLDCSAGGSKAGACGVNCPGGSASFFGFGGGYNSGGCTVACDISAGAYACCKCGAGGGDCKCRSKDALRPCPKPEPKAKIETR